MKKGLLSGNQLKLIALVAMTVDHMGQILFGQYVLFRIIGRLAMPIFAWMIAEGCRHTRSMGRYLASMVVTAALCQGVYFVFLRSVYMCIFVTFSLSVGICWLLKLAQQKKNVLFAFFAVAGIGIAFFLTDILPLLLSGTDYSVDYGFLGVMLPVVLFLCKGKKMQLVAAAAVLCLMAVWLDWKVQWFALLALPLLALYNGSRGKWKLKWLFYIYYPAHLAILWLIEIFIMLYIR